MFYDKKEQVIDVIFTSYGKYLLSIGKFKPAFYQFSDDDIIYDHLYADVSESQNTVQDRIKEVPYNNFQESRGVETSVSKKYRIFRNQDNSEKMSGDYFSTGLGNSDVGNNYSPAWSIKYLNNIKTGSILINTTGSHEIYNIPVLQAYGEYKTTIEQTEKPSLDQEFEPRVIDTGIEKIYSDGSFISLEEDFILLEFNEKNVPFLNENFDIEIYQKRNISNSKISGSISGSLKELIPLKFVSINKDKSIEERILDLNIDVDIGAVEYFFDIKIDNEIDKEIMCKYVQNSKSRNILSDRLIGNCKIEIQKPVNIYDIAELSEEDCT